MDDKCHDDGNDHDGEDDDVHEKNVNIRVGPGVPGGRALPDNHPTPSSPCQY